MSTATKLCPARAPAAPVTGLVVLALLVGNLAGCELRSFELNSDAAARPGFDNPDGFGNVFFTDASGGGANNGGRPDGLPALPDGAVLQPDGRVCEIAPETCNGIDDDCDGVVDNGFDLANDPGNCGACGRVCVVSRALPACTQGTCGVSECLPGWFDSDGTAENGCECLKSNDGAELCDGADNDCDGQVDEGFAFATDLANCGGCGKVCDFPNAAASCAGGICSMGACEPGRIDRNQRTEDGCEYDCVPSNGGVEVCDGVDNDCDGGIDNDPVDAGAACGPEVQSVGICTRGVITCTSGRLVCLGAQEPGIEVCDGRDNNCDGLTDEGFDKQSDIRYCGNCTRCGFENAVPRCSAGVCQIEVCSPGFVNLNVSPADGCEYACTFRGQDVCNGADDDCDGLTDEGIDKTSDPRNCGQCGQVCAFANAVPLCQAGACALGSCNANFYNLDGLPGTGCEYFCVASGAEVCDGVDNDCDGLTDEGIDKTSDANNCGQCGRRCQFANAGSTCASSSCAMGSCLAGYANVNGSEADGCEYACSPSNGGVEVCDGKDNDCDGSIDESDPQLAKACYPDATVGCDPVAGTCRGLCKLGTYSCLGGQRVCQNHQTPRAELCDDIDNDCDGTIDNGFDKANDPRTCGACGTRCTFTNAVALCQASSCTLGPCQNGWVNQDGDPSNGCEYSCTPTGPEVCDGKDNDCDRKTDEADPDLLRPGNFCLSLGACGSVPGGAKPECRSPGAGQAPDWLCSYGPDVQLTAASEVLDQETWCDGKDNDCDGATDEFEPTLGATCSDDGVGSCRRTGTRACDPADKTQPASCRFGAPAPLPSDERCDDEDNDCDGLTDEAWDNPPGLITCGGLPCRGVRDDVVYVAAATTPYFMYQHEASRPDALAADPGAASARACSKPGVLSWTSVTFVEAQAACATAGMRLCRTNRTSCATASVATDEWGFACAYDRTGAELYPYGNVYQPAACNGLESWASPADAQTLPTGAKGACKTADLDTAPGEQGAFDMSGNVSEWTEDCAGTLGDGRRIYTLRGGDSTSDHYSGLSALRCNFSAVAVPENYKHPATGFRCCSLCPPGQAECGGACVNLATHGSHCGQCGNACGGGTSCSNGRCQ
ncbi:MAG: SUMF1/EgtB/PvdO family nonheme iron enzyme [Myxococcales bacterium]|nr:SUMF1/EgtB/PvdO family nonheme iron enzyme [Myxococcales bacterium]